MAMRAFGRFNARTRIVPIWGARWSSTVTRDSEVSMLHCLRRGTALMCRAESLRRNIELRNYLNSRIVDVPFDFDSISMRNSQHLAVPLVVKRLPELGANLENMLVSEEWSTGLKCANHFRGRLFALSHSRKPCL